MFNRHSPLGTLRIGGGLVEEAGWKREEGAPPKVATPGRRSPCGPAGPAPTATRHSSPKVPREVTRQRPHSGVEGGRPAGKNGVGLAWWEQKQQQQHRGGGQLRRVAEQQ
ncbi:hypothetical protein E2C01_030467 [Portunus trituberculatus]|uniref:Uncharacterized protein n=1 Tax=Portunus trituberculatus TaxID=210409 RepID=A0A5B7EXE2_PORTR|nr:hypothetical protein [Portunus trituberculatus]